MDLEGIRYVFGASAVVLLMLIAWLWAIAAKVARIDVAARDQRSGDAA